MIADNKLAECAGWDRDLLAIELQGLAEIDLDFDLEVTGFETAEIDLLIGERGRRDDPDPADAIAGIDPTPRPSPARATSGRSVRTGCSARIPWTPPPIPAYSETEQGPDSSSSIRPTTYGSTATSRASAKRVTPSSRWPAAR